MERYPESTLAEELSEEFDDSQSVWRTNALSENESGDFLYLSMDSMRASEVVPFCARIAAQHNLTCFDLWSETLLAVERPDVSGPPLLLMTGHEERIHNPDPDSMLAHVQAAGPENPWLVLARSDTDDMYMQVYQHAADCWNLEHRAGSSDRHYSVCLKDAPLVAEAFQDWMAGGETWQNLSWSRITV